MNLNDALSLKEKMEVCISDLSVLSPYSLSREKGYVIERVVQRYLEDDETKKIIPISVEVIISNDENHTRILHHSMIEVVRHFEYSLVDKNRLDNLATFY